MERERFPDLIIILAKIELNILVITQHHACVNITYTVLSIFLNALLSRARTVVVLFDVLISTKLHVSVQYLILSENVGCQNLNTI